MPSYTINENNGQCDRNNHDEDKSFKACVCLLLIFITLCGILFLASVMFQKKAHSLSEEDSQIEYIESYKPQKALGPNEKIVEFTTRISKKELEGRFDTTIADKITAFTNSNEDTAATTESGKDMATQPSLTTSTVSTTSNSAFITDVTEELPKTTLQQYKTTEQILSVVPQEEKVNLTTATEYEDLEVNSFSTNAETIIGELTFPGSEELTTTTEVKSLVSQSIITTLPEMHLTTTIATAEVEEVVSQTFIHSLEVSRATPEFQEASKTTTALPLELNQTFHTTSVKPELSRPTQPIPHTTRPTCLTSKCKSVASKILYHINPAQDPCEDFYKFACGGPGGSISEDSSLSTRKHEITKKIFLKVDKMRLEERSKGIEDMVQYYEVCMKGAFEERYDGKLKNVMDILKAMNLHRFMAPQAIEGVQNVTVLFEKTILMQLSPIFDLNVGFSFGTGNKFRMEITPSPIFTASAIFIDEDTHHTSNNHRPISAQTLLLRRRCFADLEDRVAKVHGSDDLSFMNRSVYSGRQDRISCLAKYRGAFVDAVLNISRTVLECSDQVEQAQMEKELTTDLVDILDYADKVFLTSNSIDLNPTADSIENVQNSHPIIIWAELFSKLTSTVCLQNTEVYWKQKDSLEKMFKYLQTFPAYRLYNTFLALFATDLYVHLVEPQTRIISIRTHCQMEAISLFNHMSSDLYIKSIKLSDQETMDEFVEDIFTLLKTNLTGSLQAADWLDERSKTSCVNALDELTLHLANDELSLTEDEVNDLYKNVKISHNYAQNYVDMVSLNRKLWFELHGQEFKMQYVNGFFMNSYDIEPRSIISENLIAIPMGMVDTYRPMGIPRFLVMARIGIHVALELAKRFDPAGIAQGITLSESAKQSYNAFKGNVIDQFTYALSKVIIDDVAKLRVQSDTSLNSRIADSAAFRLVLDAFGSYQELESLPWLNEMYNNEQIYIIATIQEFCQKKTVAQYLFELFESPVLPPAQRVENMVTNTLPFAKAFKCPEGVNMNSQIKLLFPYIEAVESEDYIWEDAALQ